MYTNQVVYYLYRAGKSGQILFLDTNQNLSINPLLSLVGHSNNINELIKLIKSFKDVKRLHVVGKKTLIIGEDNVPSTNLEA